MYTAIVSVIHTMPFPNADRLLLGNCRGYQVVVGKDTQDGELGVFFPCDGQLSEEFCQVHDLIGYTDPVTHEKKGGFFARNRRVRAQRFRGEKSDGFWVPLSYMNYAGDTSNLNDGDELTEFNGHPICNKYETAATKAAKGQQPKAKRRNIMFAEHIETEQLRYYADKIQPGSFVSVTEKVHGTSHRTGMVLEEVPLPKWATLVYRLTHSPVFTPRSEWMFINGTRRTVLDGTLIDGYYKEGFRLKAVDQLFGKLHKGEVIYFEIVGWVNESTPIMAEHDVTKSKDKAMLQKYGPKMVYKYGQPRGECDLYVYRITQVNEDGYAVELPWAQVKARCRQLGVKHVPELATLTFNTAVGFWHSGVIPFGDLTAAAEFYADGESTVDPSHIREGVVFRVEAPDGTTEWYKYKSFEFLLMEGIVKDDETVVDIEEAA